MTQKGNAGSGGAVPSAYTSTCGLRSRLARSLLGEREKQSSFLLRRGSGEEPVRGSRFPLRELAPGRGWAT